MLDSTQSRGAAVLTRRTLLTLPLGALLPGGAVLAQQQAAAPESYTDPAKAGPDFLVQGEYEGRAGGAEIPRWGAQIVALGRGKFQGVFLGGGLPGAGWDGKTRIVAEGTTTGELTEFQVAGATFNGRIGAERYFGEMSEGVRLTMRKSARKSPTREQKPPPGAVVLFDGQSVAAWEEGAKLEDGLLAPGARTREKFRDFYLHLEFRLPFRPAARGQQRGNSGVYLLGEYEIQILDSFGSLGAPSECGALYRQKTPDVNMCLPPLAWQTFDVEFRAPRLAADGEKEANARISLQHNGVVVHKDVEITGPTGGARRRPETAGPGPILLQNHRNPVHFRNIWLEPRG